MFAIGTEIRVRTGAHEGTHGVVVGFNAEWLEIQPDHSVELVYARVRDCDPAPAGEPIAETGSAPSAALPPSRTSTDSD